jgi:hypothetical protein
MHAAAAVNNAHAAVIELRKTSGDNLDGEVIDFIFGERLRSATTPAGAVRAQARNVTAEVVVL